MNDPNKIDASPTKEFFIHMLTRDVALERAIIDLIDNSVDSARNQIGNSNKESLDGFSIELQFDESEFFISDNCGGFSPETAREYAFRFGRPNDAPSTPGSIGQFGVGMKRTIFKLGRRFEIQSITKMCTFEVNEDINEWMREKEWEFRISNEKQIEPDAEGKVPVPGIALHVTKLVESVATAFSLKKTTESLIRATKISHAVALAQGLKIVINGHLLSSHEFELVHTEEIIPAHHVVKLEYEAGEVSVEIIAGIVNKDDEHGYRGLHDGGWYVFCNGRMVMRADQGSASGWGEDGLPRYHADFAYFRGYVFFTAENASLLPWTTTKTGVDVDSIVYRRGRQLMAEAARPILTFLRDLATEKGLLKELPEETEFEPVLQLAMDTAKGKPNLRYAEMHSLGLSNFTAPLLRRPKAKQRRSSSQLARRSIQYTKPSSEIEKVIEALGVSTLREVGEATFDYFLRNECD